MEETTGRYLHTDVDPNVSVESSPNKSQAYSVMIRRGILRVAAGRVRNLHVEVNDGVIRLEGTCNSFYCKQLAQHAAMELAQGWKVNNRIEVS